MKLLAPSKERTVAISSLMLCMRRHKDGIFSFNVIVVMGEGGLRKGERSPSTIKMFLIFYPTLCQIFSLNNFTEFCALNTYCQALVQVQVRAPKLNKSPPKKEKRRIWTKG